MAETTPGGAAPVAPPRGARIGVDVGKARVGVARSDPDGLLATPVRTLRRDLKKAHDIVVLSRVVVEYEAHTVYVGEPQNLHGADTASTEDARGYARVLAHALQELGSAAEVRLIDERLSTVSAQRALHANGRDVKNSRDVIDQAAAVEILQFALDMEKSQVRPAGRPLH